MRSAPNLDLPTPEAVEYLRRCAISWARKHERRRGRLYGPTVDYEGAALEALARAIAGFDRSKGKFGSYATGFFRPAVLEEERACDRVSRKRRGELSAGSAREPFERDPLSLRTVVCWGGEEEGLLEDGLLDKSPGPEPCALEAAERAEVADWLRVLPERHRFVIERWYWHEWTFGQIAQALHVSESRSHQLHNEAIKRLRNFLGATA